MPTNIFTSFPPATSGERMDILRSSKNVRIERLAGPVTSPQHYRQPHPEWVVLLVGSAVLELGGERMQLTTGDTVFIKAAMPHTLLSASEDALWLAVHEV